MKTEGTGTVKGVLADCYWGGSLDQGIDTGATDVDDSATGLPKCSGGNKCRLARLRLVLRDRYRQPSDIEAAMVTTLERPGGAGG